MKHTLSDIYGNVKEVTKEHQEKILSMDIDVQSFYLRCNDFDLNKKYPVEGFETEFTGMDILVMMDKMKEIEKSPTAGLILKYPFYVDRKDNVVGYSSFEGFTPL